MSALRSRRPGEVDDGPTKRQPVPMVHVDQTAEGAEDRVRLHLPAEDAPKLLAGRFQIINLWRPIAHPAWDWPLALCDFSTVNQKTDLIPLTAKYPDRDGESMGVKFSEAYRWKYLRGMAPEEVVLIKWYANYLVSIIPLYLPNAVKLRLQGRWNHRGVYAAHSI